MLALTFIYGIQIVQIFNGKIIFKKIKLKMPADISLYTTYYNLVGDELMMWS